VDAGHISIESDLADKDTVLKVQSKRKQEYTNDDYKRLEALMYDKFTLKLESAQVRLADRTESMPLSLATVYLRQRLGSMSSSLDFI
jgi:vacuolar protein sorting-associated protein 13A/C